MGSTGWIGRRRTRHGHSVIVLPVHTFVVNWLLGPPERSLGALGNADHSVGDLSSRAACCTSAEGAKAGGNGKRTFAAWPQGEMLETKASGAASPPSGWWLGGRV